MAETLRVVAKRRYAARPETVFRAFTERDLLARWFSPSEDIRMEVERLEVRVGGRYRLGFRFPDGSRSHVIGEYHEITPPSRLAFTWTWEEPDPHAGIVTRVEVDLHDEGSETEVVVTHTLFPDEQTRERHDTGWNGALGRLERLLRTTTPGRHGEHG